jgi:hypothetical protein
MTDPTTVNSQITDSVTQTNTKVIGETPAQAMGDLYQQEEAESDQQAEPGQAGQASE